jgi:hypothetical protein
VNQHIPPIDKNEFPNFKANRFNPNKILAFTLVALLGGGGLSVNQMLRIPGREELRDLIREESQRSIARAADDAADKAIQRVLERQHRIESRIDQRIDELYRRVDALAPYAAAVTPIVQRNQRAMRVFNKAKDDGFEALEEIQTP